MDEQLKRRLFFALRVVVTAALLVYAFRQLSLAALAELVTSIPLWAVALGLGITALAVLVSAWRWQRVLAHLGERVPLGHLYTTTLVACAYNLLLPTSVGGDVARAVRCRAVARDPHHAWVSVVFERLVGFASLALFSALGLCAARLTGTQFEDSELIWVALVLTCGFTGVVAFASWPLAAAAGLGRRFGIPAVLTRALARSAELFRGPLAGAGVRTEIVVWSMVYQVVSLAILVPSTGLETRLLAAIYFGLPIALIGAAVPISIGGFGVRETLFVVVLAPFGVSAERALALSLLWVLSNIVVALAGAGVLLFERR